MAFGLSCAALALALTVLRLMHGAIVHYVAIPIRNHLDA